MSFKYIPFKVQINRTGSSLYGVASGERERRTLLHLVQLSNFTVNFSITSLKPFIYSVSIERDNMKREEREAKKVLHAAGNKNAPYEALFHLRRGSKQST